MLSFKVLSLIRCEGKKSSFNIVFFAEKMKEVPFLYLTLDLPAAPLYRDELMQNIIPQVPLGVLLQKFNGQQEKVSRTLLIFIVIIQLLNII